MLKPQEVATIWAAHTRRWEAKRADMRLCKAFYNVEYWKSRSSTWDAALSLVERPKGYKVVEGIVSALHPRNAAVVVEPDLRGRGTPEVAEAAANRWLGTCYQQLEDITRLACIFPGSYMRLAVADSIDPLRRVVASAIPPWEVIVDYAAAAWDQQRWVGHTYLLPLVEAAKRYGKRRSSFQGRRYSTWLEDDTSNTLRGYRMQSTGELLSDPDDAGSDGSGELWITIVEMYDLVDDKLIIWSPDYLNGDKHLFKGVKIQVGALPEGVDAEADPEDVEVDEQHETTGIPYRSASGRPVVPIIPLLLSHDPEVPLQGTSMIWRIRDLLREDAITTSRIAAAVKKSARQMVTREGVISEEAAAKIAQGVDGEIIEVDVQPGTNLADVILPISFPPTPAELPAYAAQISADIDDAGLMAPFTRGDVTGTTATEQNLLATYTSSEIGRMARVRDAAISEAARVYCAMLAVILGDDVEPLALPGAGPVMLSAEDLTGDFRFWAADGSSTPISTAARQQQMVQIAPLLVQLGADPAAVRAEIVKIFDLSETLATAAPPPPESMQQQPAGAAGMSQGEEDQMATNPNSNGGM